MPHKKKKTSLTRTIVNLVIFAFTLKNVLSKVVNIIGYEARLAGKSFIKIIIFAIFSGLLLVSIWFCLLTMLYLYLESLLMSPYLALTLIIFLNIFMLIVVAILMHSTKKNLFFNELRKEMVDMQK